VSVDTKTLGAIGTSVAVLAVVVCVMAVAMEFPTPVEVAMIAGAGLLLVSAGGLIGAGITSQKKPSSRSAPDDGGSW
jgi:hypothetical protein